MRQRIALINRLQTQTHAIKRTSLILFLSILTPVLLLGGFYVQPAKADEYDAKIRALRAENNEAQAERVELQVKAEDLSDVISELQADIARIEKRIAAATTKRQKLLKEIKQLKKDLAKQRVTLGKSIRAMYLESDISTFEVLASSNNLTEFVNREQYRESVQSDVMKTVKKIKAIQKKVAKQKATVEKILKDQRAMRAEAADKHAETKRLLGLNKSEQSAFESSIRSNNARISELQRRQAAENARNFVGGWSSSGGSGANYPWKNAPFPNSMADPWGMYKRQCVSYTAWRVASSGRHMPYWGGRGNANQWDDNARAAGIPVGYTPRVGDVAVSNAGYYGHVMYVEAVHGDGTISISQYNAGWDGRYSTGRRSTAGLVFIHF